MLTVLVGPDRVALSDEIFSRICKHAAVGTENQILIVPEQFSHEAERKLCLMGGDTISRYAEVLSFSRMSDRVAACHGGIAQIYLDKGGQLLTMAYAAELVSSRIKLYAAVLRKPEFLAELIRMIDEFKSYCLEPEDLRKASEIMEGQFAQKLEELALLYEAYLSVCEQGRADPGDRLVRLCRTLADHAWASDRTFYINGFSDFTGTELAVIELLLSQSNEVTVTLPVSVHTASGSGITQDTLRELQNIAQKFGIELQITELTRIAEREKSVQYVLDHFFSHLPLEPMESESVRLRSFHSVEHECRNAVHFVKTLLKDGARCRDISIACTDPGTYLVPLRSAMCAAELPAYFAGETDLLDSPVIGAVIAALDAASGSMEYEDVARYLKSWIPELDRDNLDRLDNYAYQWGLRGRQWENEWVLHPRGFGELWNDDDRNELLILNQAKELVLAPLLQLRHALLRAKKLDEMVTGLYAFLEAVRLQERLEEQANLWISSGQAQKAQEISQIYEVLCQSMEQLWAITGETVRSPDEFAKLYKLLLERYKIGTIPAGLDQIHVSDLPDLRNRVTKHLLVLGCGDGMLPAYKSSEGILTDRERLQLLHSGVQIAPSAADQMDRELERIGAALASASDSLWMSYCGEQPAWLFRRVCAMFPASVQIGREETFLDLQSLAAWRLRNSDHSQLGIPGLDELEESLRSLRAYSFAALDKNTVRGLYGKDIYLSASRIDKYSACRFAFFLAYGMKAQPRKRAKMDPSVFGTFVHAVLEQVVQRVIEAEGFREISAEKLLAIATEEINAYASTHFPEQAQRAVYLFARSKEEILDIVLDLGAELKDSLFQPVCCELEFSSAGRLPAVEVRGKEAACRISGFVDRVDLYDDGKNAYVRVVDYKTGRKDFDYTDILNGAGLQMLVYLFALRQYGASAFMKERLEPAGVLYLPARKEYTLTAPLPEDASVIEGHMEERRRKGLISSDPQLLAAMEADPEAPRFMPYTVGKSGPKGNLADHRQMILLERHVLRTLANMADQISGGSVTPNPVVRGQYGSCRYCDYASVCHKDFADHQIRVLSATTAEKFWDKLEQEESNHG